MSGAPVPGVSQRQCTPQVCAPVTYSWDPTLATVLQTQYCQEYTKKKLTITLWADQASKGLPGHQSPCSLFIDEGLSPKELELAESVLELKAFLHAPQVPEADPLDLGGLYTSYLTFLVCLV